MKASALAHAIQGLVKYHGLRDRRLRIPYHDSISACVEALHTTATVEFDKSREQDHIIINDREALGRERERVETVLNALRRLGRVDLKCRVATSNSLKEGKGLGFSASAFAAIGLAASTALGLRISKTRLSEVVRLGAGSAARSLVGDFAIWYANRRGRSYAEVLAEASRMDLQMAVLAVPSRVRTEAAHEESVSSPFFMTRLAYIRSLLREMKGAIRAGDLPKVCLLAERDSLNLHAVTMTGKSGLVLMGEQTIRAIRSVLDLRKEGVPAWFSVDTGPSVFVNTDSKHIDEVSRAIRNETAIPIIQSLVGSGAKIVDTHLF